MELRWLGRRADSEPSHLTRYIYLCRVIQQLGWHRHSGTASF